MRRAALALAAAAMAAGCSAFCPSADEEWPQPIVDEIAKVLGGERRMLALNTVTIEGVASGTLLLDDPGEVIAGPYAIWQFSQTFDLRAHDWSIALAGGATEGRPAVRRVFGLRGSAAYNGEPDGVSETSVSGTFEMMRRRLWYHHPLTVIRAALEGAEQCCGRTFHERIFEIATGAGSNARLTVLRTGLVWIITSGDQPAGGIRVDSSFDDYRDVGGWMLPFRIKTTVQTTAASSMGPLRRSGEMELVVKAYTLDPSS